MSDPVKNWRIFYLFYCQINRLEEITEERTTRKTGKKAPKWQNKRNITDILLLIAEIYGNFLTWEKFQDSNFSTDFRID